MDNSRLVAAPTLDTAPLDNVTAAWLGVVVPKRNAKRAVTRTLLKRQMRNAALRLIGAADAAPADPGRAALRAGLWVVRLRAPFDRTRWPSAASDALRGAARDELDALFRRAARKTLPPGADGLAAAGRR